ncbi:MAG: hypothetical protein KF752_11955 [Pirellulaceae bacterium]|nr:hypothetical protein [Pirellulaceae bacterium]
MKKKKSMQCDYEYYVPTNRGLVMQRVLPMLLLYAVAAISPAILLAQGSVFEAGPLVDHPVSHPITSRSSGTWRTSVGAWGENFSDQVLRLRGFNEIHEVKHGSNNGIDRIAVKRSPTGQIKDVKFVEVKTTRSSRPKLGHSRYGGRQMSRRWLAANLRIMRNSGDPALRSLALAISRFRKAADVPIESMGEVIHVNSKSGRLTGYTADGRTMSYGQSIERLLKNIQAKAGSTTARYWATRTLAQFDQIRATGMTDYLGKTAAQQSRRTIVSNSSRNISSVRAASSAVLRQSRSQFASTILKRSAGRGAVFIVLVMGAKEIFDVQYAYRNGTISVRQRNIQLASTVGGMIGTLAGAKMGMVAGAWIGTLGGPIAWATVPVGAFTGGVVGGIGGYLGGSALANYGATAWYESIDGSVREKFEVSWLNDNGIGK